MSYPISSGVPQDSNYPSAQQRQNLGASDAGHFEHGNTHNSGQQPQNTGINRPSNMPTPQQQHPMSTEQQTPAIAAKPGNDVPVFDLYQRLHEFDEFEDSTPPVRISVINDHL